MEEINIKEFFSYYCKFIVKIIMIVIICGMGAYIYSKYIKTPMYSTSTTIVLVKADETINQTDISLNQKLAASYSQIIKSRLVVQQVIDNLRLNTNYAKLSKRINVSSENNNEILKINVSNEKPNFAYAIANELTKVFSNEVSKIYNINNVTVLDEATLPTSPSNINTVKTVLIASAVAFVLCSGLVFIIFYFDDAVRDLDTLESEVKLPILTKVFKDNSNTELVVEEKPNAAASEGIRNLRTALQFSSIDKKLKMMLITSSIPSDGKSFMSANLAISFAQTGKKTLLVDCDLRKGRQHQIFKVENKEGLSNLLIDDVENCSDYIYQTDINNLYITPRGTIPPNPSELLNSKKSKLLFETLRKHFDIVILDGAPISGLSDSLVLSSLVDTTVLVATMNQTPKTELLNAKKSLEVVSAKIAGIVVNKVVAKKGTYGSYYYYYGYNEDHEKTKKKKFKVVEEK